jgi:hypothetical protein
MWPSEIAVELILSFKGSVIKIKKIPLSDERNGCHPFVGRALQG